MRWLRLHASCTAAWYKSAVQPALRRCCSTQVAARAENPVSFPSATRRLAGDAAFMNLDLGVSGRLERLDDLEANVRRRGLGLDVRKLCEDYHKLQGLFVEKQELERRRQENADIMKSLVMESKLPSAEKEEVIRRGKVIKSKLKQLLEGSYRDLERSVMSQVLRLPVDVHSLTPDTDVTVHEAGTKRDPQFEALKHLELGSKKKTIVLRPPVNGDAYYLTGDLALLERQLVNGLVDRLGATDLLHIICPDMVKPFIAEAFDADHLQSMYVLEAEAGSPPLTLTGVSPLSFAASLSYMNVLESSLPIQYYSVGTSYTPPLADSSNASGLYSVPQSITADMFGAARDASSLDALFDKYSSILLSVYKAVDLPFKLVSVGAKDLRPVESRRLDVLLWSPGFKKYFPSGSLSAYDDLIGRRLTMKYSSDINDIGNRNFLHTVHCRVMRVSSVIASLMEHSQDKDGTYSIKPPQLFG